MDIEIATETEKKEQTCFSQDDYFMVFLPTHSITNHDGYAVKTAQLLSATGRVCTQRQEENQNSVKRRRGAE